MKIKFIILAFLLVVLSFTASESRNVIVAFSGSGMTGGDTTAPEFSSATINADAAAVTLSEDVVITLLDDGDFVMTGSTTGAQNLTGCTEDAGVISCTAASEFVNGETVTLAYSGGADEVEDVAGNDLDTFSGESVTNNTSGIDFPSTTVKDDFNRTDVGPPIDGAWTTLAGGFKILSNAAVPTDAGDNGMRYNANQFGPDVDVYVTVVTASTGTLRLSSLTAGYNGYGVFIDSDEAYISRVEAGIPTNISSNLFSSVSWANGDSFGLRKNGSSISFYYKPAAGAWQLIDTQTDATYDDETYGVLATTGAASVFDNYGGGTYTP